MTVLALITARGGSKGIPRKNIADLGGQPLIAWSIHAAQKARTIKRIIVSTDDHEIATIARAYQAEVPFLRPDNLAQDHSPHLPVVLHAIQWIEQNDPPAPEIVVLLQPTSPFRTAENIDQAVLLLRNKQHEASAVVSVITSKTPLWLLRTTSTQGFLQPINRIPDAYLRRQDAPPLYQINGALYACKTDALKKYQTLTPPNTLPYIMTPQNSLDIDEIEDLEQARKHLTSAGIPQTRTEHLP